MHCLDVNVLVYTRRSKMIQHEACRDWLETQINGNEPFCIPDPVQLGFVRIVTNPRIFRPATSPQEAFAFLDLIRSTRAYRHTPSHHRWQIFRQLCLEHGSAGDAVPDAYVAAVAFDGTCHVATCDRGFRRFTGLDVFDPSTEEPSNFIG